MRLIASPSSLLSTGRSSCFCDGPPCCASPPRSRCWASLFCIVALVSSRRTCLCVPSLGCDLFPLPDSPCFPFSFWSPGLATLLFVLVAGLAGVAHRRFLFLVWLLIAAAAFVLRFVLRIVLTAIRVSALVVSTRRPCHCRCPVDSAGRLAVVDLGFCTPGRFDRDYCPPLFGLLFLISAIAVLRFFVGLLFPLVVVLGLFVGVRSLRWLDDYKLPHVGLGDVGLRRFVIHCLGPILDHVPRLQPFAVAQCDAIEPLAVVVETSHVAVLSCQSVSDSA